MIVTGLEQIELSAQLAKEHKFANFAQALTNHPSALPEAVGHQTAILTERGKVNVRWRSHEISGRHKSDFIMAAKTDLIII